MSVIRMIRERVLYSLPPRLAHQYIYNHSHDDRMDFHNPLTLDQKIHWLVVYYYNDAFAKYADKYEVRDYIAECGYEDLLVPLCGKGIYNSVEEIDLESLPNQFIAKATHGSGNDYYYICQDKRNLDFFDMQSKLKKALSHNYAIHNCEYHYRTIKPRIICEQLLSNEKEERLTDYKVFCSYGRSICILVCRNRDMGRDYYSTSWEYLDYTLKNERSGVIEDKPEKLREMIIAAERISEPFPCARIDFYCVGEKLYFGEITLTPAAGKHENIYTYAQEEIGKEIKMPYENRSSE